MRSKLHRIVLGAAVLVAAALVAVPAFAHQQRQSAVNIKVKAVDLKFIVPLKKAPHGAIQFSVTN